MAVTTIPWGDGSGDNIYLTYSASQGDQTVLVSSDANNGAARQKVITFLTTVGNVSRSLTVSQEEGASLVSITWNNVCITYDDTAIGYQDTSPQYVQDGLVFWLDGIDKGEGADTWVEKKNGYVFTNHGAVFNPDHVYLDGTAYLDNNTATTALSGSGTIEVVYEQDGSFGTIIFPAYTGSSLCGYSIESGRYILWATRTNRPRYLNSPQKASVSISLARAMANGVSLTQNSQTYISQASGDIAYIGRRPSGKYFTGKLYCIRVYDRQLTEEEVLANYVVDCQRFKFDWREYITFEDPAVEQICVSTWGDGTGLTKGAALIVSAAEVATAFSGNTEITSFDEYRYFEGITDIPTNQFNACSSLESIILPSTVVNINAAFRDCTSLERIEIPAGAAFKQANTFQNDTALSEITFRGATTFINYTFQGCTNLRKVNIPDIATWFSFVHTLTQTVGQYSHEVHLYLIGSETEITEVVIPDSITTIESLACFYCTGITSLTIPSTVTSIGTSAFEECTSLSGSVVVPSSVTTIGNYAFNDCYSISNLTINCSISTSVLGQTSNTIVCGNGTGTLEINGDLSGTAATVDFRKFIVNGDVSLTNTMYARYVNIDGVDKARLEVIKIRGDYSTTAANAMNSTIVRTYGGKKSSTQFVEITGVITSSYCIFNVGSANDIADNGCIFHLGYDVVANNAFPCTPDIAGASFTRLAKIYVGDGSSASHDNAILAQYTSDTDWSAYTDKLDTWYNYINGPNANPDFIN